MSRWIKVTDKFPPDNVDVKLKCEKGNAWGFYDKELDGWMVNVTQYFGSGMNIGKVIAWKNFPPTKEE